MFSLAVTAYNEITEPQLYGQRLLDCIRPAQQHYAIKEIVVVDDGSTKFDVLQLLLESEPKVKLFRNESRQGVFTNKVEIIARATTEWVITCDSDNCMSIDYIDQIISKRRSEQDWYCPSFARPSFDYRGLTGTYTLQSVGAILDKPQAYCAMNTGNQTVHRESFMRVFGKYRGVKRFDLLLPNYMELAEEVRREDRWWFAYGACDSILFNVEWLQNGNRIEFVPGLEYQHYVHSNPQGSNFDRAPREKGLVNEKLIQLLREAHCE